MKIFASSKIERTANGFKLLSLSLITEDGSEFYMECTDILTQFEDMNEESSKCYAKSFFINGNKSSRDFIGESCITYVADSELKCLYELKDFLSDFDEETFVVDGIYQDYVLRTVFAKIGMSHCISEFTVDMNHIISVIDGYGVEKATLLPRELFIGRNIGTEYNAKACSKNLKRLYEHFKSITPYEYYSDKFLENLGSAFKRRLKSSSVSTFAFFDKEILPVGTKDGSMTELAGIRKKISPIEYLNAVISEVLGKPKGFMYNKEPRGMVNYITDIRLDD